MGRKNIYTSLVWMLLSIGFCFSCTDEIKTPDSLITESDEYGVFLSTPPDLDVSLLRSSSDSTIQKNVTEQGVLVKISERPWVGMSLEDSSETKLRSTWNDIVWDPKYASIGVFTVKSADVDAYLGSDKSIEFAEQYIKCFPFRRDLGSGNYGAEGVYRQPSGNSHSYNPDNYRNANFMVDARSTTESTPFFANTEDITDGIELNFYGYFPYQHQTAGINYTLPATSICRILQANLHIDNLLAMPYTFAATQNGSNIRQHDLMYSVSEDGVNDGGHCRNRYGNRYKKRHDNDNTKNDNVHMRFVHSFCRLQINIAPGNYHSGQTKPIKLSKLYLTGDKVFVDGNLNLIEGIVSPGTAATIYRALDTQQETVAGETYVDLRKKSLSIPIIVQPTGKITSTRDFKIVCVVDGVEYTCSLQPGVELETNHVYDVNLVLDPETKILVSSGGGSNISGYLGDAFDDNAGEATKPASYIINRAEENQVFTAAKWMVVNPNPGWRIFKILENGEPIDLTDSSRLQQYAGNPDARYMSIGYTEGEVRHYTVVCIPNDWYASPENLITHLDGKLNTGFKSENDANIKNELVTYWRDISYNGNDGVLYNFETAASAYTMDDGDVDVLIGERSGWDGKGLRCDGKDDRVGFPGKINPSAYTVSVYACIERDQPSETYPRIVSSGNNLFSGFPGLLMQSETTTGRLRIYGHEQDALWGNGTNDAPYHGSRVTGVDIVQMDYTYSGDTIRLYINGVETTSRKVSAAATAVDWTAIGGRLSDISRQCHITYYNVMVYDKALGLTEIQQNYNLNNVRYGTQKAQSEPKTFVSSGGGSTIKLYKGSEFNGVAGMQIQLPSYTINGFEDNKLFRAAEWMVVEPKAGWKIFKIIGNGTIIASDDTRLKPVSGSSSAKYLDIKDSGGAARTYNVICIPDGADWYAAPEMVNMHLDGRLNQGFRGENVSTTTNKLGNTWKDISYNGNDGELLYFATAEGAYAPNDGVTNIPIGTRSGWDGKGLFFDGMDDRVRFPGKINTSAYTVSFYVCLEENQQSGTPPSGRNYNFAWIVSGGNFPGLVIHKQASPYRLRIYGHGQDELWGNGTNDVFYKDEIRGKDIVQIDYTYENGTTTLYINGVSKTSRSVSNPVTPVNWATLGGRTASAVADFDRQVHMTYYNVIVYNKALTPTEIQQNFTVNKTRYGTHKTD